MMTSWYGRRGSVAAIAIAASLVLPHALQAQSIGAAFTQWWADGNDMVDVTGGTVAAQFSRVSLQGGYYSGTQAGFGIPCAGLLPPDSPCVGQPIEDRVRMYRAALGRRFDTTRGSVTAAAIPTLGLALLDSRKRGTTSNLAIDGRAWAVEAGVDAELAHRIGTSGFSLSGTAGVRRFLISRALFDCRDCYQPFDESFGALQLSIGLRYSTNAAGAQERRP